MSPALLLDSPGALRAVATLTTRPPSATAPTAEWERAGHDVGQPVHVQLLEHLPGVGVYLNHVHVDLRTVRHVLHPALPLLFLQLEGNTADGTALDSPHQVRGEAGDLVAQTLGRDRSHLLGNLLVDLEVQRKLGVILLHDDARSLLHGLRADATHDSQPEEESRGE